MAQTIPVRKGSALAARVDDKELTVVPGQDGVSVEVLRGIRYLNEMSEEVEDEEIRADKRGVAVLDWLEACPD